MRVTFHLTAHQGLLIRGLLVALWLACGARAAWAQEAGAPGSAPPADDPDRAAVAAAAEQPSAAPAVPGSNPWENRPACASMFFKADWQLSHKQRACAWLHNGVFSTNAILGALWSARFSQEVDLSSERGDGFVTRFGRKFGQSAIKSTAIYLGSLIADEDTRKDPPYLVMRGTPPPRGLWKRLGGAIAGNVISRKCTRECTSAADIKRRFALSRLAGSVASGFAGELFTTDRSDSLNHALRGSASAYAATFGNAVFDEFKPELSAFAGRLFRAMGGSR